MLGWGVWVGGCGVWSYGSDGLFEGRMDHYKVRMGCCSVGMDRFLVFCLFRWYGIFMVGVDIFIFWLFRWIVMGWGVRVGGESGIWGWGFGRNGISEGVGYEVTLRMDRFKVDVDYYKVWWHFDA